MIWSLFASSVMLAWVTFGQGSSGVSADEERPPYPPSPVIQSIHWAKPELIERKAKGSDNWPVTWGDDDRLYTAYGDGRGFRPYVEKKLSLGLATVSGSPKAFSGTNLRLDADLLGDGRHGHKASGMLMIDGVLYMLVRNAGNSQLSWSNDRGKTWKWGEWKFTTSFGCPTFLNFGSNYEGAIDDFVYIYSFDSVSAYQPADRMVLARVEKTKLKDRSAYEFFARLDADGAPQWSRDLDDRGSVFSHPNRCYRSGVTYNAPLGRFLWVQIIPNRDGKKLDTRFDGGFGVYDAPNPWGPWTTVYFTEKWDVGPGESASFPTKWMSVDGLTIHLVFSGDDCFSVRQAKLKLRQN